MEDGVDGPEEEETLLRGRGRGAVLCEVRVERGEAAGFWFQGEKEMTDGCLEKKKMVSSGLRSKIETGGGGAAGSMVLLVEMRRSGSQPVEGKKIKYQKGRGCCLGSDGGEEKKLKIQRELGGWPAAVWRRDKFRVLCFLCCLPPPFSK